MLQIATRSERNLPPYLSPKKAWDNTLDLVQRAEVFIPVEPSTRGARRQRQRDQLAMGRKSRRTAARQRFAQHQAEQNYRGMAQVLFNDAGTPAMYQNVTSAIFDGDEMQYGRIVDRIREIAVEYGDMD